MPTDLPTWNETDLDGWMHCYFYPFDRLKKRFGYKNETKTVWRLGSNWPTELGLKSGIDSVYFDALECKLGWATTHEHRSLDLEIERFQILLIPEYRSHYNRTRQNFPDQVLLLHT